MRLANSALSTSVSSVLQPAGFDHSKGIISSYSFKDPNDPQWKDDKDVQAWHDFMKKYFPDGNRQDQLIVYGYVVAEGQIRGVREEVKDHPMQILLRCDQPGPLAAKLFALGIVVEAKLVPAEGLHAAGVLVRTTDANGFYLALNRIVVEDGIGLESVSPADDDVLSVYQYLIGGEGVS